MLEFDLLRPVYMGGGWVLVCSPCGSKGRVQPLEQLRQDEKSQTFQKGLSGHWYCTELDVKKVIAEARLDGKGRTVPAALEHVPLRVLLSGWRTKANPSLTQGLPQGGGSGGVRRSGK